MDEFQIILNALLICAEIIVGLIILIPLICFLFYKIFTSNIYRHIVYSLVFIAFMYWAHSWSSNEDFLLTYWVIAIFGFILTHLILWANPIKETKSKRNKKRYTQESKGDYK